MNKFDIYSDFMNFSSKQSKDPKGNKAYDSNSINSNYSHSKTQTNSNTFKRHNNSNVVNNSSNKQVSKSKKNEHNVPKWNYNKKVRSSSTNKENSQALSNRNKARIMTYENYINVDSEIAKHLKQKQIENHCDEYSRSLTASTPFNYRGKSPTLNLNQYSQHSQNNLQSGKSKKERFDVHDLYKVCMTSQNDQTQTLNQNQNKMFGETSNTNNYNNPLLVSQNKLSYDNNNTRNNYYDEKETNFNNYKPVNTPNYKTQDNFISTAFTINNPLRTQTDVNFIYNSNEKLKHLLNEKVKLIKLNIIDYEVEKEKLENQIYNKINTNDYKKIEMLDQEIKYYQNLTKSCIKSSSQLTEEIMMLKKELSKFVIQDSSLDEESFNKKLKVKKAKK